MANKLFLMHRFEIPEKKQPIKNSEKIYVFACAIWLVVGLYHYNMYAKDNLYLKIIAPIFIGSSIVFSLYTKQKKQQAFVEISNESIAWDWYGLPERKIVFWNEVQWAKKENGAIHFCTQSSFIISFPLQEIKSNSNNIEHLTCNS